MSTDISLTLTMNVYFVLDVYFDVQMILVFYIMKWVTLYRINKINIKVLTHIIINKIVFSECYTNVLPNLEIAQTFNQLIICSDSRLIIKDINITAALLPSPPSLDSRAHTRSHRRQINVAACISMVTFAPGIIAQGYKLSALSTWSCRVGRGRPLWCWPNCSNWIQP